MNPANFTIWHYRRLCLQAIYDNNNRYNTRITNGFPICILKEMKLASILGGTNPKNYQIWYHRRAILEQYIKVTKNGHFHDNIIVDDKLYFETELRYITEVLQIDQKNYHAWSQRQWVLRKISSMVISSYITKTTKTNDYNNNNPYQHRIWGQEMIYVDTMIQNDIRNNSAWNQRWFVIHQGMGGIILSMSNAIIEANYSLMIGTIDPHNESPFRYLLSIIQEQIKQLKDADEVTTLLVTYYDKCKLIEQEYCINEQQKKTNTDDNHGNIVITHCSHYLSGAMIDLLELIGNPKSIERAVVIATELANKYDIIRQQYWNHRIMKLQLKL